MCADQRVGVHGRHWRQKSKYKLFSRIMHGKVTMAICFKTIFFSDISGWCHVSISLQPITAKVFSLCPSRCLNIQTGLVRVIFPAFDNDCMLFILIGLFYNFTARSFSTHEGHVPKTSPCYKYSCETFSACRGRGKGLVPFLFLSSWYWNCGITFLANERSSQLYAQLKQLKK